MIVWLASYPKSGNTWVRAFINSLFLKDKFNLNRLDAVVDQFPLKSQFADLVNNLNDFHKILENSTAAQLKLVKDGKIKFLKTHSCTYNIGNKYFINESNTLGSIHIVRDPRNVFLSMKNHFSMNDAEMENFFFTEKKLVGHLFDGKEDKDKDYILRTLVGTWKENYISWSKVKNNNLLIKYENLIDNPVVEFSKIVNFLENIIKKKFEKNEINSAIEKVSFYNLQNLEKKDGFKEASKDKNNKIKTFFKGGPNTNWEKLLDVKIRKRIENEFKKEMVQLGYL